MKRASTGFAVAAGLLLGGATPAHAASAVCERWYTSDADFDAGTLLNVNHDVPDQLQLNQTTTPFPFVNIACSARGTVARIDVVTGAVLGEYLTSPDGMGRNPSRTTVDRFGNVWVANRDEGGLSGGESKGSVTRIGLVLGGTRCDADGTPNASGQYLKPPFGYSTAVDRDLDGLIKTSFGLGNILPWSNAGAVDTHGGVATADDECIINYTRVTGAGTRTVAIDANNDVWVGGLNDMDHEKLDGVTGQPIPGTQFNVGIGGYGGLIDGNGVLWSARGGGGLLRYDTGTPVPPNPGSVWSNFGYTRGDYGLGIDPTTGHIWHSSLSGNAEGLRLYELDGAGNVVNSYAQPFGAQGVCVDSKGHVWMAELFGARVWHLAPNPIVPGTHYAVGIVGGFVGTTGVAVDANGKVWAAENGDRASRIDPLAGPGPDAFGNFVGAIDLSVNLGPGAGPYNYSDMTGFVSLGATAPSGTWTVVHDGAVDGTAWGTIDWNAVTPQGTAIRVEVRAADVTTDLPSVAFQEVANGASFCDAGVAGRFVEVRVTLSHDAGVMDTPILQDLKLTCCNQAPVAQCQDVEVAAGPDCLATASVDAGSYDPDGDPIVVTQEPPGPYGLGSTPVVLTVTDDQGATDVCEAVVTVVDRTPPTVECRPTTNPSGNNIPKAGTNPKSGQNPDGFYELLATDACDEPQIFVADSASTFVAGPFASGTQVKITQAPGTKPGQSPMAGVIVAHLRLRGDPRVYAVDSAGNTSEPCACLVPPPPK